MNEHEEAITREEAEPLVPVRKCQFCRQCAGGPAELAGALLWACLFCAVGVARGAIP